MSGVASVKKGLKYASEEMDYAEVSAKDVKDPELHKKIAGIKTSIADTRKYLDGKTDPKKG